MSDAHEDLYGLVRAEFEPVRLHKGLDDVTARGRVLRRRRRVALTASLAAVAAVSGLTLTLPTAAKTDARIDAKTDANTDASAPIRLAAWSVETAPDGAVVLTIRQLTDADRLTTALQAAGVPALVEFVRVPPEAKVVGCAENDQPSLPEMYDVMPIGRSKVHDGERVFTIRRDRMPSGTSLHFVIFAEGAVGHSVSTSLVRGEPLPCEPLWSGEK